MCKQHFFDKALMKNNKKLKILITDDDPRSLYAMEMLLSQESYELHFADGGLATIAQFETDPPDVLLLDVMMPDMTGYEVCRHLKTDERWQHIPIILVTALDRKDDIVSGLEAGADEFLSKPVHGPELRARVQSVLRIKQQHDAVLETLQLREDMANMVVHDMRSPLAALMLCADLLRRQGDLSETQDYLAQQVVFLAHNLDTYATDLLLLAKMSSGKLALRLEPVDMVALVLAAKKQYLEMADSRDIELVTRLPDQQRRVLLDKNLMHRVIDNLLSNAFKFSPDGAVITLQLAYRDKNDLEQSGMCLQIIDQGPGIPEEHLESIFDAYEIADVKQPDIPQLGLGLAFCKMVVTAHEGQILAGNNETGGAVFTIEM